VILAFSLEMGELFLRLLEYFLLPGKQLLPEIFPLALIHEWLFVGRPIAFGLVQDRCAIFVGRHLQPPYGNMRTPARAASLYRPPQRRTIRELIAPRVRCTATEEGGIKCPAGAC